MEGNKTRSPKKENHNTLTKQQKKVLKASEHDQIDARLGGRCEKCWRRGGGLRVKFGFSKSARRRGVRSYEEISAELAFWREKRAACDLVVASVSNKILVVTQKRAKNKRNFAKRNKA